MRYCSHCHFHCGQNGITILEPGTQIDGAREIATDGKKDD